VVDGYSPIADYAIIGDCHTAALVSKSGSIDWYCPGRFDAPAVFCRLLDADKGGFLSVTPLGRHEARRRYVEHTNVLETVFTCDQGAVVRLTDFMAIHRRASHRIGHDVGTSRQILRLVEGTESACGVQVRFKPTFDFARGETELRVAHDKGAVARQGAQWLALYCPKLEDVSVSNGIFGGRLELRPGERSWIVLSLASSEQAVHEALDPGVSIRDLERTIEYWHSWTRCCDYKGHYRDAVERSALTLKLLTYEPTGAVVAAPTTSLPELIGGLRNWDYRYTWLRDASLMLYALSTLGYHEEATDFIGWLAQTINADPHTTPQIMYTLDGGRELPEMELGHLSGYRNSGPVRIGNAASDQHQLDIYGDVLSAAYHFRHSIEDDDTVTPVPPALERMSRRNWQLLAGLVEEAADSWQQPDSGIWEVRGGARHYVYSKLMCWTALDRGIRLSQEQRLPAPIDRWTGVRDEIRKAILERGYNHEIGAFTQALDGYELDASVLAIPRVGFLPATDVRVQSTINRILEGLMRDGMIERYHADDGLPGSEGTFALCSFWMVDALAMGGRLDEARELFERLLSYTNDVGLLSEEIEASGPDRLLGNFPQGFSHMALIGSAVNLAQAAEFGAERQAKTEPERALRSRQVTS
jgi:GH15 family glucan-1,4-alpha-glucosidase